MNPDPQAREQADAMENDMDQNRRMMADCTCGKRPTLEYIAGVTWGGCLPCKRVVALPDWEPKRVRELWNEKTTKIRR